MLPCGRLASGSKDGTIRIWDPDREDREPDLPFGCRVPLHRCTARSVKLYRARSRLYQSKILQPNTHFAAFFEIYKISNPLHQSKPKFLEKNLQTFSNFFPKFCKNRDFSIFFIEFCTDSDENFSEFRRIFKEMLKVLDISEFLMKSSRIS